MTALGDCIEARAMDHAEIGKLQKELAVSNALAAAAIALLLSEQDNHNERDSWHSCRCEWCAKVGRLKGEKVEAGML